MVTARNGRKGVKREREPPRGATLAACAQEIVLLAIKGRQEFAGHIPVSGETTCLLPQRGMEAMEMRRVALRALTLSPAARALVRILP